MLLLLPQRQEFSSKSQLITNYVLHQDSCCCYHKGRNFQANHNFMMLMSCLVQVVVATTKVGIFKQITTITIFCIFFFCCCCYHKGRNFQANHNNSKLKYSSDSLLLLPQRQEFSSKSQLRRVVRSVHVRCCCYHKGRNFQANHNQSLSCVPPSWLLLLPQRQEFSSKSQP